MPAYYRKLTSDEARGPWRLGLNLLAVTSVHNLSFVQIYLVLSLFTVQHMGGDSWEWSWETSRPSLLWISGCWWLISYRYFWTAIISQMGSRGHEYLWCVSALGILSCVNDLGWVQLQVVVSCSLRLCDALPVWGVNFDSLATGSKSQPCLLIS